MREWISGDIKQKRYRQSCWPPSPAQHAPHEIRQPRERVIQNFTNFSPGSEAFDLPSPHVAEIEQSCDPARKSQDILGREEGGKYEISCRDAYLLIRAYCKLSMKDLGTE